MTEKYLNSALSAEERAKDLLSKMSLAEKLGQVQCFGRAQMGKRKADDLFPHGFGQVSNLIAVAMPTEQAVAKMVNEDQRLAMRLSDHHIPALFHIESLSGPWWLIQQPFHQELVRLRPGTPSLRKRLGRSLVSRVGQWECGRCVPPSLTSPAIPALAGMDAELPIVNCYNQDLVKMIENGQLDEAYLDRAVYHTLVTKFKLGLFEHPFAKENDEVAKIYSDPAAKKISREAAAKSVIMLKNDGALPLNTETKRIAVIGCHADSVRSLFGCYTYMGMKESTVGVKVTMAGIETDDDSPVNPHATVNTYPGSIVHRQPAAVGKLTRQCYPQAKSLFAALKDACPRATVEYAYGFPYVGNDDTHFAEALAVAKKADVVVLTLGGKYGWNMTSTTGEGIDSQSINLPAIQDKFIKQVAKLGKTLVGVHFDGRPISSDVADKYLNAIIEAWTPGEFGGEVLADIMTGKINPSGKLTCSVARNAGQIPVYYNHDNGSGTDTGASAAFNTYVDGPRTPRYAFGHGLSYTSFKVDHLRVDHDQVTPDQVFKVSVDVKNTGHVAGAEVVQLYFRDEVASMVRPNKQLAGFKRVELQPSEKETVTFIVNPSLFAFLDEDMKWKVEHGQFTLLAGDVSDNLNTKGKVTVTKDALIDGTKRQFVAQVE